MKIRFLAASLAVVVGLSASSLAFAANLTFNENQVALTPNVSRNVTISGGNGSYSISSNSNVAAISATINGNQVILYGSSTGTADILICDSIAAACGTLTANIGGGSGVVTFNPTSVTTTVGQSQAVAITGSTSFYVSTNSTPGIISQILAGNVITITGVANGSTVLTICPLTGGGTCAPLNITVGGTTATGGSAAVSFNNNTPTVAIGQNTTVILNGSPSYYVKDNSNQSAVQTSIDGSVLSLFGLNNGAATINVCAYSGAGCSALSVTVGGSATPVVTPATTTTTPTPVVTPAAMTASSNPASLLTTIQTMQTQLAQMLLVIQTMQSQLALISGALSSTTGGSAATASVAAPAVPFSGTFTSYLALNSTGAEVLALQKKLVAEGFLTATPTGTFGPATQAALKKYQADHNLEAAGYVGPGTRAALNGQ